MTEKLPGKGIPLTTGQMCSIHDRVFGLASPTQFSYDRQATYEREFRQQQGRYSGLKVR